ncbi:MAG: WS/DGAT/MGAT family O-acyltransferase [Mycobacteriales bacterium]
MSQDHLDRLTSIDAGFLHQERGSAHMHIGGLGVFSGPSPTGQEFRDHIASRLPQIPRYRQRIAAMPLGTGRPVWVDDTSFRLDYHVRHAALPTPGNSGQLLTLVSRSFSQRLDRMKPLWELWLVEGLADDRFAIIAKTHHAMIDGVGGMDLLAAVLDLEPDAAPVQIAPWRPQPTPGTVGLLTHGASGAVRNLRRLGARGARLAVRPQQAVREALSAASALGAAAWPLVTGAPSSQLNRAPGPDRRVEVVHAALADHKLVKNAFGATVNDVVLTVVAGALGRFMSGRGIDVDGRSLRACIPVSMRAGDTSGAAGNKFTIVTAALPIGPDDAVQRLTQVHREMVNLKAGRQADGARVLGTLENAMPPVLLAQVSRLGFSSRTYNLLVTNLPGPQVPVYLLGRELVELAPLAFLAPEHTLAIAVVSYHGQMTYALLGDADALPDLADLTGHLEDSLAELVAAAITAGAVDA